MSNKTYLTKVMNISNLQVNFSFQITISYVASACGAAVPTNGRRVSLSLRVT